MIEFRELSDRDEDISILGRFYRDLYVFEFPDPDERESLANMKDYLRLKAQGWYGENNYHILIALDDGQPCGGAISDYLAEANAGAIEFLVVGRPQRGTGLGQSLLQRTEALLRDDAKRAGRQLDCVVAEMNDPFRPGALDDGFDPFVRARIWESWGYSRLDFPYEQPALSTDQQAVSHLMLVAKPMRTDWCDGVPSATVKAALAGYMRWAMRIDAPDATPEFQRVCDFLGGSEKVPLTSLGSYVGVSQSAPLTIEAIQAGDDLGVERVLGVYRAVFPGGPTDIDAEGFRRALRGASAQSSRYHLWAIRERDAAPVEGVASFFTFPACGFGGYVALTGSLKGTRRLPLLLARMEEQILRDGLEAHGWFIECEADREAIFRKQGFHTVDIEYRQPPFPGRAAADTPVLLLMYKEFGRRFAPPSMSAAAFLAAMRQIFAGVYEIAVPEAAPALTHLEAQVMPMQDGFIRFR